MYRFYIILILLWGMIGRNMLMKVYLVLLRMGVWSVGGIPLVTVIRNTWRIILSFLQALSMSIALGWIKMVPLIAVIFHFGSRKTSLSKRYCHVRHGGDRGPDISFIRESKKKKIPSCLAF